MDKSKPRVHHRSRKCVSIYNSECLLENSVLSIANSDPTGNFRGSVVNALFITNGKKLHQYTTCTCSNV